MMWRARLARLVPYLVIVTVLAAYGDHVRPFVDSLGFWFALPVLVIFSVGLMTIGMWLEDRVRGKARASVSLHNRHTARNTLSVSDWDNPLAASDETVDEAIRTGKVSEGRCFAGISSDDNEIIARWRKSGWEMQIFPAERGGHQTVVRNGSKRAGTKLERSRIGYILRGPPIDRLSDEEVKAATLAFFGLADLPANLAKATIEITHRETAH